MTLKMIVHKDKESGFWGEVPSLPGCVSQAETVDELRENMKEAVEGWLKVKEEEAESLEETQIVELSL